MILPQKQHNHDFDIFTKCVFCFSQQVLRDLCEKYKETLKVSNSIIITNFHPTLNSNIYILLFV